MVSISWNLFLNKNVVIINKPADKNENKNICKFNITKMIFYINKQNTCVTRLNTYLVLNEEIWAIISTFFRCIDSSKWMIFIQLTSEIFLIYFSNKIIWYLSSNLLLINSKEMLRKIFISEIIRKINDIQISKLKLFNGAIWSKTIFI